jgi:hypothetical protein
MSTTTRLATGNSDSKVGPLAIVMILATADSTEKKN